MSSESSSNDGKTKAQIWNEIYQNAFQDREKASMLVTNLWKEITADPEKHALYGVTMTKYLERMSKSNDQLVKLAELMQRSDTDAVEEDVNIDDVYSQIGTDSIKIKPTEE